MADPGQHDLVRHFEARMLEIYERAGREVGYWATRYLQLVRRRGGLDAARYLLNQKVTSDGYAHLRDAGRLDLTVEHLVLESEFQELFSVQELGRARDRLERYRAMPLTAELQPSPELLALVDQAATASPDERIRFRDPIADHGAPAIVAMHEWIDAERPVGFAVAVIERVGQAGEQNRAIAALHAVRSRRPAWADLASAAISRLTSGRTE
jgi:hypothetical protein